MQSVTITPNQAIIELPISENYVGKKIMVTYTIEEVNIPAPAVAEKVNTPAPNVVEPAHPGVRPKTLHGSATSTNGGSGTMHEHG